MSSEPDKKKVCLKISKGLYQAFNQRILEKYGQTFGHIGKSMEEGMKLWLEHEKSNEITSEENVQ